MDTNEIVYARNEDLVNLDEVENEQFMEMIMPDNLECILTPQSYCLITVLYRYKRALKTDYNSKEKMDKYDKYEDDLLKIFKELKETIQEDNSTNLVDLNNATLSDEFDILDYGFGKEGRNKIIIECLLKDSDYDTYLKQMTYFLQEVALRDATKVIIDYDKLSDYKAEELVNEYNKLLNELNTNKDTKRAVDLLHKMMLIVEETAKRDSALKQN